MQAVREGSFIFYLGSAVHSPALLCSKYAQLGHRHAAGPLELGSFILGQFWVTDWKKI